MRFACLGSGSEGNGLVVEAGSTLVLLTAVSVWPTALHGRRGSIFRRPIWPASSSRTNTATIRRGGAAGPQA